MRKIIQTALDFRFLVLTIAAVATLFGVVRLREMPVDTLPEFSPPIVSIQVEALGLSAEETEAMLTVPLEANLLNGVAFLDTIQSETVNGLASITLEFEPGTDSLEARQMVQERLTQAQDIPNVSDPPVMLQPLSSSSRVMLVRLSSDELSLIDMSVLAHWNIVPRLMGVPGVANVAVWGERKQQLQVQVDPQRLRVEDVTLFQIVETTGESLWVSPLTFLNSSAPGTGGFIDTPNQRLGVRHVLPIVSPEDLAQVSVIDTDGLQIGDVANVVEDHQPLIGDTIFEGGTGLLLVVEKFPGENTLEVTEGVEEALETLRPGLSGMEIDTTVFRPANFVEESKDNLAQTAVISFVLIMLVIALFFWNWRSILISLIVIPLSIVVAGLALSYTNSTINSLVVGGFIMAVGVVIINAIVDVENVMGALRQKRSEDSTESTASILMDAMTETRVTMMYVSLIMVLTVLPFFFLDGNSGDFYRPLAVSYILAIFATLLVALIVTPVLSFLLFSGANLERRKSPVVDGIRGGVARSLSFVAQLPTMIVLGVVSIFILIGLLMIPILDHDLIPTFEERDLVIEWQTAPGTSLVAMNRMTTQAANDLRAISGVRNVNAHVGRAVLGDEIVEVNSGQIWVSIDPSANYNETLNTIEANLAVYPGVSYDIGTYSENVTTDLLTSNEDEIRVRVYGHELDVLRERADELNTQMAAIDGIASSIVDVPANQPYLTIQVDLDRAEAFGLKPGDVRRSAAILISGLLVGNLFEEQKVFDVIVWATPESRENLTSIRELLIDTPNGGHVRLGDVATVSVETLPGVIRRDAVSRYMDVVVNVEGRSISAVADDIDVVIGETQFPLEYHAKLLDDFSTGQASERRFIAISAAVVIGIFLLLQAAYESWRLAAVSLLSLPAALAGSLVAVAITGGDVTLGAVAGMLAVLGIAAFNALGLFRQLQQSQAQEDADVETALILRESGERLVPIMIIAVTLALATVPMILFGNTPGHEIAQSFGIATLGGLITTTIVSLLLIALYLPLAAASANSRAARSSQTDSSTGEKLDVQTN